MRRYDIAGVVLPFGVDGSYARGIRCAFAGVGYDYGKLQGGLVGLSVLWRGSMGWLSCVVRVFRYDYGKFLGVGAI